MPQCTKHRRTSRVPTVPWVSLRSRSLSVRLRSRTAKRLTQAPVLKRRKPKRKPKRLPVIDPIEEETFLYGHAFDVLLALGLVPSQQRREQEDALSISLNRMHVMEGECEKSSEMVAESAPELVTPKTSVIELKLGKEELLSAEPGAPEPPLEAATSVEPVVNGDTTGNIREEKTDSSESVKCLEQSVTVNVNGDSAENSVSEGCRTKEENVKEEKDDTKETKEVKEIEAKEGSGGCSEEEDQQSVTSSQSRKRVALAEVEGEGENSSSESDGGGKRPRLEPDDGEDERERLVREYVEECTESVEEMSRAADKLQREIGALGELLRAKELEWNSILRLRKLKEEMLERLLRRRRLASVLSENGIREDQPPNNISNKPKIININNVHQPPCSSSSTNNGSLMMVPIVSSGPGPCGRGPPRLPEPRGLPPRPQRPILPKPGPQEPVVGEGRQGPILDVKSIIADYRSRHPENVPRRGRRMRGPEGASGPMSGPGGGAPPITTRISGSPALMSMANMALGSGSHVRENPPYMGQENSRPSSADSSRSGHHLDMLSGPGSGGLSFKDALVQFAKMSQPNKPPPPPPPYPEVTLHPVPAPHSPPAPPPHSSLLHGILTKSAPGPRATTFSPTLARLLTAPERAPTSAPMPPTPTFRPPHHHVPPHQRGVNISEILSSSKKNRNEITITPVSGSNKTKDDVVMLQDEDEEGDGDRLVIDEGRDNSTTAVAGAELPENVPQCQGCHQRAAQFVCAGCGNQWYCSRDCQVNAWEEHSEMCSG